MSTPELRNTAVRSTGSDCALATTGSSDATNRASRAGWKVGVDLRSILFGPRQPLRADRMPRSANTALFDKSFFFNDFWHFVGMSLHCKGIATTKDATNERSENEQTLPGTISRWR